MEQQAWYETPSDWVSKTIDALQKAGIVVMAPMETEPGVVNFARITSADQIVFDAINVEQPMKRFLLPISEVLFDFERKEDGDIDIRPPEPDVTPQQVVVFGSRPCDAASLVALDKVAQWDYDDLPYRSRRERTTVVSFACTSADPECFCTSVGGSPQSSLGSDVVVFFREDGSAFLQSCSPAGGTFVEHVGGSRAVAEKPLLPEPPDIPSRFDADKVKTWLDENFESDFWFEASLLCLGCGACTYLCPTCHCFDIVDEGSWNRGQRRRNWDSCSFAQFTAHASGHNPRPDQAARYRQRIMHKFKYFPERFDQIACVGCGRCVKTCRVGQSLLTVLADIDSK